MKTVNNQMKIRHTDSTQKITTVQKKIHWDFECFHLLGD